MNEANGRFWMVYNDGPTGRTPTYKHPSLELAKQEAERLATLNPGMRFRVLEAQGFMHITPPSIWTPAEDGCPW